MPLIAGGAIAAGGALGNIVGSGKQASAAQNIAQSQLSSQQGIAQQALGYAQPTTQDLAAMQQQLQVMNNQYSLGTAQLQKEATLGGLSANEAQALMNGQAAPVMAPYQAMVQNQQNQLQNSLAAQMGPGWQTSTAGQQGMQQFGLAASLQGSQLQQQYLQQMLNQSNQTMGQFGQYGQAVGGSAQGLFGMGTGIQGMQIGALTGTNPTSYMGAGSTAQLMQGQQLGGMGTQMMGGGLNLGTMAALSSMYGGGGGAAGYGSGLGAGTMSIPSAPSTYTGQLGTVGS
jgi:hypothetical protein